MKKKKVFIIAGEVSGDVLGGEIMRASGDQFDFAGIGGAEMKSAGLKSLFPISDLSVMGFVEVLKKSKTLLSRIRQTADAIAKRRPDVVLTIDSSSFATRVIRRVRRRGGQLPKFYHVVAPMVWAWGAWRAKKYARVFDKMFCFFDFEVPYFTKYGLDATAIGYPIYDVARRALKKSKKKYIALLPGSRMGEVSKMMPVFKELASRCGAAVIVSAHAGSLEELMQRPITGAATFVSSFLSPSLEQSPARWPAIDGASVYLVATHRV